ncbi:MAG: hypothetical protein V3T72_04500 [Thermoanaerobaculia bacterium]
MFDLALILLLAATPAWAGAESDPPSASEAAELALADHGEDEHGDQAHTGEEHRGKHSSRLSDEVIPLLLEGFPQRPKPILELGEPYLGTGTLDPGFQIPTGAVWQPAALLFGTFRTAIQTFEPDGPGDSRVTEWANRLDLFLNLQLSGSERLVVGIRALDEGGRFTSYFFEHPDPALNGEFRDQFNAEIETFFFEGDFGEIFPNLDRSDFKSFDVGFSVGRQSLFFQEGILINDTLDGIGLTRNTLQPKNTSNFRLTFFYGWDNVDAGGLERSANLFALLTSTDFRLSTVDFDVVYVDTDDDSGDLVSAGLSAVQRLGKTNSSFRILGSFATSEETAVSTDGVLLFSELSWTPHYTEDHFYVNAFWAIDEYSSAARGPATGGPLGRAGINFAAVGLGSFGAPLSNRARNVAGGAIGYQKFMSGNRKQVIIEAASRIGTEGAVGDSYALTTRFQAALRQHYVVVVDGFVGSRDLVAGGNATLYGGRLELVVKF